MALAASAGAAYIDQAAFVVAQLLDQLDRCSLIGMELRHGAVDVVCDVLLHLLRELILEMIVVVSNPAPALAKR